MSAESIRRTFEMAVWHAVARGWLAALYPDKRSDAEVMDAITESIVELWDDLQAFHDGQASDLNGRGWLSHLRAFEKKAQPEPVVCRTSYEPETTGEGGTKG
jgi:hypothetical protein